MIRVLYQFCDSFSFLIFSAAGLSIIFGMMGIINLAHGEFMMMGAYITSMLAVRQVPLPVAILAGSVGVGVFGLVIDRLVMCRLYDRKLDSVVATWGISLVLSQGAQVLFGSAIKGVSTPFSSVTIGNDQFSVYRIVLFLISLLLLGGIFYLFNRTEFGLHARATMQECDIAASLGVNSDRMYALTFAIGSALAGLSGSLYAPTMTIAPSYGNSVMMQGFVTVIVGGANPLVGTVFSGAVLGVVNSTLSMLFGTFSGRIGLLAVAIVFIRIFPTGFSGLVEKVKAGRSRA